MMFLYKPHITGPEGDVTTPDVIVDKLHVDGAPRPVMLLSSQTWQQSGDDAAEAGCAVTALGGGAILAPATAMRSGLVVVSRMAWRLKNVDTDLDRVTLNDTALNKIGLTEAIAATGGKGDALPRGHMVVTLLSGLAWESMLADPVRGRELSHRVVLEDIAEDRWNGARPRPRYSVGPTRKEVTHYI